MKPILFNTEMVRAILAGQKTQTRRKCKPGTVVALEHEQPIGGQPYYVGDILWVRETWGDYREYCEGNEGFFYLYKADYPDGAKAIPLPDDQKTDYADSWDLPKWHPSIHMPREAARIFLRVTNVRIERLQDIDDEGVMAEGIEFGGPFEEIWDSTVKRADRDHYGWDANPWVWVIEFERIEAPEQEVQDNG